MVQKAADLMPIWGIVLIVLLDLHGYVLVLIDPFDCIKGAPSAFNNNMVINVVNSLNNFLRRKA